MKVLHLKSMKMALLGLLLVFLLAFVPHAFAFTNYQAASAVLGQTDFTSNGYDTTQTGIWAPYGVATDPSGNVWVADCNNNRVLEFAAPFYNGEAASVVLGQTDFTSDGYATTQTGMYCPHGIAIDPSGNVWVAEYWNNRVLEFVPGTSPCSAGQFCDGMPASVVLGQTDFTSSGSATTQTGMWAPLGIASDKYGNLWVADSTNNRVLEFIPGTSPCPTNQFCNGMPASVVLGQTHFTYRTGTFSDSNQTNMHVPYGVGTDPSGNVWVADSAHARVLEFEPGTFGCPVNQFCNGMPASVVLGQKDFTSYSGSDYSANQTDMWGPSDVATDPSGNVWVADSSHNRVIEFEPGTFGCSAGQFCNGMPASVVLGQNGFSDQTYRTTQQGMYTPISVASDSSGNVFVADLNNNRVLCYLASPSTTCSSTPPSTSTTTSTTTVTSPTTTTKTASTTTYTGTTMITTTATSLMSTVGSTATSTSTAATSTTKSTTTILSGICYDPEVTVTQTLTSFTPTTVTTTTTYNAVSTGTQTVTTTSTATLTTTTVAPVTRTTTMVSSTTECSTTASSSSSTVAPPLGVPQFPLGSSLAVAAIGILALAAFMRVRAPRKPVPA